MEGLDDMTPRPDASTQDRPPPLPERDIGGAPCDWDCPKWARIVVEHQGDDGELRWACLTHVVHAEVAGWRQVWPAPRGRGAAPVSS